MSLKIDLLSGGVVPTNNAFQLRLLAQERVRMGDEVRGFRYEETFNRECYFAIRYGLDHGEDTPVLHVMRTLQTDPLIFKLPPIDFNLVLTKTDHHCAIIEEYNPESNEFYEYAQIHYERVGMEPSGRLVSVYLKHSHYEFDMNSVEEDFMYERIRNSDPTDVNAACNNAQNLNPYWKRNIAPPYSEDEFNKLSFNEQQFVNHIWLGQCNGGKDGLDHTVERETIRRFISLCFSQDVKPKERQAIEEEVEF